MTPILWEIEKLFGTNDGLPANAVIQSRCRHRHHCVPLVQSVIPVDSVILSFRACLCACGVGSHLTPHVVLIMTGSPSALDMTGPTCSSPSKTCPEMLCMKAVVCTFNGINTNLLVLRCNFHCYECLVCLSCFSLSACITLLEILGIKVSFTTTHVVVYEHQTLRSALPGLYSLCVSCLSLVFHSVYCS